MRLAAAAQVLRIERKVDEGRRGRGPQHTEETVFALTSYWPQAAGPEPLLAIVRDPWQIENGQHDRRDRTQDEDRRTVRDQLGAGAFVVSIPGDLPPGTTAWPPPRPEVLARFRAARVPSARRLDPALHDRWAIDGVGRWRIGLQPWLGGWDRFAGAGPHHRKSPRSLPQPGI